MAFRLIPREERFFDDFVALAEQIRKGSDLLVEMLVPDHPIWDKADEIKEVEHKCDFLTHEIIQRLHRTFVTPLDREDIHALARSLDDVMDAIDASAAVVRLYQIERVRPERSFEGHPPRRWMTMMKKCRGPEEPLLADLALVRAFRQIRMRLA